jgi:fructokinase
MAPFDTRTIRFPTHAKSSPVSEAPHLLGAIEAGGTKFVCAVGHGDGGIVAESRIETQSPATTLPAVVRFFAGAEARHGRVRAFGLAAFGPVDLRRDSPQYGFITSTPKPGWQNTDLLGTLQRALGRPFGFDTDVNAAALAELRRGAGRGLSSLVYITIGTGIGGGVIHHGRPVHGLMHPEIGHVRVLRHPADTAFAGVCPFHGDCLEGLANGPAILARTGHPLSEAPPQAPIWDIEADYLGQLCAQLVLMHSPERILLGGGVMQAAAPIFGRIRERMHHWLAGYVPHVGLQSPDYVTAPGLGAAAGIQGGLCLALGARFARSGGDE